MKLNRLQASDPKANDDGLKLDTSGQRVQELPHCALAAKRYNLACVAAHRLHLLLSCHE